MLPLCVALQNISISLGNVKFLKTPNFKGSISFEPTARGRVKDG